MGPIIWGALGIFLYLHFTKKEDLSTIVTNPVANPELLTQPEQKNPVVKMETPRVDNADQPWYTMGRRFLGDVESAVSGFNIGDQDAPTMEYHTNEFWDDINSRYGMH